ncbi:hypothetical protein SLS64_013014 [Diaporthe eres]
MAVTQAIDRRKNRIEHLETRLMSLESALRRHEPDVDPVSSNDINEREKPVRASLVGPENGKPGDSSTLDNSVLDEPAQELVTGGGDIQANLQIEDLMEVDPNSLPATSAQQDAPTAAQILSKYSDFTQDVMMGYQWIRAHENRDNNQSKVFARLPTYQQVSSLIEPIVESLQHHGAVITAEVYVNLLDKQYLAGPDCYADDPARWAIVNSFFGTAMLTRSTTDFLKQIMPTAWNYFKNAFSMFPKLITQGRDVLACEALLSMVTFAQCTADTQLTVQITAAATRLVQTLGLHRRRLYQSLDPIAAQRYRRVFWVAYILDVDAVEKYDLSPSLAAEELAVTLEHDDSPLDSIDSGNFGSLSLLRWRAELAVIQRQIHERLNPAKTHHMKYEELLNTVSSMDEQLQSWQRSLPEQIWTIQEDESDFTLSIAHMHCTFYNSLSSVHMALVNTKGSERSELDQSLALGQNRFEAEIQKAWTTCAVSARNMIEVMANLTSQPFFQLWYVPCNPCPKFNSKYKLIHP